MRRSTTSCILDNAGALAIPEVPKRLGVIGAGVIGLEMGSVWRRLGSEVTILEALPAFLRRRRRAGRKGSVRSSSPSRAWRSALGVKIAQGRRSSKDVTVEYTDAEGKAQSADVRQADRRRSAACRTPPGSNAEAVGLKLDERGFVEVDDDCRTNLPNVWAIGDVVRGPMLAHKAEEEGVAVAERIAGQKATSTSTPCPG